MVRYNPFRPSGLVSPGMFAGRYTELEATERALLQTKHGNPHHFLVLGERGIGKSSLMLNVQWVSSGDISPFEGEKYKFLDVSIILEPSDSYADMIHRIGIEIKRQVAEREPLGEIAKNTWDFLKRWEVAGVKYDNHREEGKQSELLDDLLLTVERTLAHFGSRIDGIVILIDEADKATSATHLGEFAKLFTERLVRRGCERVCLGFAGLTTLLKTLRDSHESSVRIFEIFSLEPLSRDERITVIDNGLAKAKEQNGFETSITSDAKSLISHLSEGYPHFLQQFAYSAFDADKDNSIDVDDVLDGAFDSDHGALKQLGVKYFQDLYFDKIGADEYRAVLGAMAENFDNWVTKAEIRKKVQIKESTLNNAISALKKRHIIIPKPGSAGAYKLPNRSFAAWIRAFVRGKEEVGGPLPEAESSPKA
jgi:hypothetical protein